MLCIFTPNDTLCLADVLHWTRRKRITLLTQVRLLKSHKPKSVIDIHAPISDESQCNRYQDLEKSETAYLLVSRVHSKSWNESTVIA